MFGTITLTIACLQCLDTVGWASEKKFLKKLSDLVMAWLSVSIEVQMICAYGAWHSHPIISCIVKIQIGFTRLSRKRGCQTGSSSFQQ